MSSTRILMINNHIHFGGGGDAAFRHERKIYEEQGYDIFTFSMATELPDNKAESDYICLVSSNRAVKKFHKFLGGGYITKELKRLLDRIKPDLIHIHLVSEFPVSIYSAVEGYRVLHTLHGPNLFCATSWGCVKKDGRDCSMGVGLKCYKNDCVSLKELPLHYELAKRAEYWCKKNVDAFLCPSRQIQQSAEELGYSPTVYLPLAIDDEFASVANPSPPKAPTILYVGALVEQKGVELLMQAFKEVSNRVENVRLRLAGRGVLEGRLKNMASEMQLEDRVEFLGFQERSRIVELYRTSTVLAVPSIWKEQFGLVGPEALACGLPVVASDIGGIPEWLHHGEWGYLVEPRNTEQLADRLVDILSDQVLQQKMGDAGREFVFNEFSHDRYKQSLLKIVRQYTT